MWGVFYQSPTQNVAEYNEMCGSKHEVVDDTSAATRSLCTYGPRTHCADTLSACTSHKIVFRVPKITGTARTLCEIKGVMWEYSYEGKHLEKR